MPDKYREIPYNYTSFSDREIVLRFLGEKAWQLIEELREHRNTGQSARWLFEVLGHLWIVNRNPFLFDDLLDNPRRRESLISAIKERLDKIRQRAHGRERVHWLHESVTAAVDDFSAQFDTVRDKRRKVKTRLKQVTHPGNVLFDGHARVAHVTDATDWRVEYPFVVINPDSEAEVGAVVRACIELGLSIIPRGGGTGYTGSAVPDNAFTAVINTEKLHQLTDISWRTLQGHEHPVPVIGTEAGVVTAEVAKRAQALGLSFAVDPTSQDASTIGGNIAMNAGGKKAVLWGTTLDNLLSWRMVTPSGNWMTVTRRNHNLGKIHDQHEVAFDILTTRADGKTDKQPLTIPGQHFRKAGLGKDVTDKFLSGLPGVQKEGCDGLITSAEFVLHQLPALTHTLCLELYEHDLRQSVPAIVETRDLVDADQEVVLSGLEHLDWRYVKAIQYSPKAARGALPRMVLLVDISADNEAALTRISARIRQVIEAKSGEMFVAKTRSAREDFWSARKRTAAIAAHTNAFKINEDVVIPLDKLADYALGIERINIEQSLANKLYTVNKLIAFFSDSEGTYKACGLRTDNQERREIFAAKQQAALELLNTTKARWQAYSDGLDAPAGALSAAHLPDLDKEAPLVAHFLSSKLRVSLKQEIIQPLDDTFAGLSMQSIQDCVRDIHRKALKKRLFVALHMHAGDGNVHTNIPVNSSDYEMLHEADRIVDRVMILAQELGGVVSGEHGIGLTKIKYLPNAALAPFQAYKQQVDPKGHFNPGKLQAGSGLELAYTPSFQLLEAEALILEATSLGEINDAIKNCLRCGKCKPVCATHVPGANLLYSPRNKILATGLIIEAILYEEQTRRGISIGHYDEMNDVADHCTMCHKCVTPCPVNIDFGDVTVSMRQMLRDMGQRRGHPGSKLAMRFLDISEPVAIKLLRAGMINFGYRAQNLASQLLSKFKRPKALDKTKVNRPAPTTGKPSANRQLVQFLANPLPTPKPGKTLRALIDAENRELIPVIRAEGNADSVESVFYFPGCGSERLFSDIGLATLALLRKLGVNVVLPPGYLCCGYPQAADGRERRAKEINTANQVLFHRVAATLAHLEIRHVIVSCGTCMDQLLSYQFERIFPGCRQLDIHEFLLERGARAPNRDGVRYLYHEPCHTPMKHHDDVTVASELLGSQVLKNDRCCGESGTFSISRPDISEQVRYRKVSEIRSGAAALRQGEESDEIKLLTSCPSCLQGLSRYRADTGINARYIITEMAEREWGEDWVQHVTEAMQQPDAIDRILL